MNGPFGNKFPYTNFHEMNLDWMIQIAKDFLDQYSNIQNIIEQGITDIENGTSEGLDSLDETYNRLNGLLDEWYNTHSEDIAGELADALSDITSALNDAITNFNTSADAKAELAIESIPSDYSSFYATALKNMVTLPNNTDLNDVEGNNYYLLQAPNSTFPHSPLPTGVAGLLVNYEILPTVTTQVVYSLQTNANEWVRSKIGSTWYNWTMIKVPESYTGQGIIPDNTDFDTLTTPGTYFIQNGYTYINSPFTSTYGGILIVSPDSITGSTDVIQQAYSYSATGNNIAKYRVSLNGTFPATWANYEVFRSRTMLGNGADFDAITTPGIYFFNSGYTYSHAPFTSDYGGTLIVFPNSIDGCFVQMAISYSTYGENRTKVRMSLNNTFPPLWSEASGGGGGATYNNIYQTEYYENTYDITCTPTITADTNNYLASTGDQTDRTADILAILSTNNTCHLGPGLFMVSGVEIPAYKSVIGSGRYTTVRLLPSVTTGYVFKLNDQTSVSDLRISGSSTNPTLSSTVGTKHGILFEGTKVNGQSGGVTVKKATVSNVVIFNFTGAGIKCTGTGVDIDSNMMVDNCFIYNCNAGIYIPYYSEYHRFTNCAVTYCYYGCVDNGGNNNFVNCDFSANRIGILIDNSTNQSPNNTHGVFSACSVNHSYSSAGVINQGVALQILNAKNGEIFNSLQIHYGSIIIDKCNAMRFSNCQFGKDITATITDSTVVTFTDCTMASASDFTLTRSGNTILLFRDCYTLGGSPITY